MHEPKDTPTRKYEIGRWNGWTGGDSPVPRDTRGHYKTALGKEVSNNLIGNLTPNTWRNDIVAFCVTEYPPEKKTRTGRCWAAADDCDYGPSLSDVSPGSHAVLGTYTVTTVDGKLAKIVWEADS